MKNGKILLVHRHAGTRALLKKGLEQNGCKVLMGFSDSSAVNILKLEDVQAAFVDLRVSESDCLDLVHRLQHVRPELAIFGLADYPAKFEIEACREAGLQGYFTAPFNVTALVNAVASIEPSASNGESRAAV
jgi:DNA-binding response OmpR family regulator